jgi:hypothetical protein
MAENKTKPTAASVKKFIAAVPAEQQRQDALVILELMQRATGLEPKMWGPSIIGFGTVRYKYESGREGDICRMGFSPRKQSFSLYLPGGQSAYAAELKRLGEHEVGKGCLYITKLADVDVAVLTQIIEKGAKSFPKD